MKNTCIHKPVIVSKIGQKCKTSIRNEFNTGNSYNTQNNDLSKEIIFSVTKIW